MTTIGLSYSLVKRSTKCGLLIAVNRSCLLALLRTYFPIKLISRSAIGLGRQIGSKRAAITAATADRRYILLYLILLPQGFIYDCVKLNLFANDIVLGSHCRRRLAGFLLATITKIDRNNIRCSPWVIGNLGPVPRFDQTIAGFFFGKGAGGGNGACQLQRTLIATVIIPGDRHHDQFALRIVVEVDRHCYHPR